MTSRTKPSCHSWTIYLGTTIEKNAFVFFLFILLSLYPYLKKKKMPIIKKRVKLTIKSQNRYNISYFSKCFHIHDSLYSHDNLLGLAGQPLSHPSCHTPAGAAITKYHSLGGFDNINLFSHPATGYKNRSFCYNQK